MADENLEAVARFTCYTVPHPPSTYGSVVPSALVLNPFVTVPPSTPSIDKSTSVVCSRCGATPSPWSSDVGQWVCRYCLNTHPLPATPEPLDVHLSHRTVKVIESVSDAHVPTSISPSVVFLVDGNTTPESMSHITSAISRSLDGLSGADPVVGFMTFTNITTVYRVGEQGVSCGDVYTDPDSFAESLHENRAAYLSPYSTHKDSILAAVEGARGGRVFRTANTTRRRRQRTVRKGRRLGQAVSMALQLIGGSHESGRIIVLTTGADDTV